MPPALRTLALAALLLWAPGANAQDRGRALALRLAGAPTPALDIFVAQNAQGRALRIEPGTQASRETFRELVTRHCGSFRWTYFAELTRANNASAFKPDAVIGARRLNLPACFFYRELDASDVPLWRGLGPEAVYLGFTGQIPALPDLTRYFNASRWALEGWTPGRTLPAPAYVTGALAAAPVELSDEAFLTAARQAAGESAHLAEDVSDEAGDMILALGENDDRCRRAADAPFDARAVETAFDFARKQNVNPRPRDVYALIVDNGFYGADHRNELGREFDASPFPSALFERGRGSEGFLAHRLRDTSFFAINYANGVAPGFISSHGTHVAGLMLGGPPMRGANLWRESEPWLHLSFLNVAGGAEHLQRGTSNDIGDVVRLDRAVIVNMSLAYRGAQTPSVRGNFISLFTSHTNALFVVAAGNAAPGQTSDDPGELELLPAGLGGGGAHSNLVTVAALDGDGGFAAFSHRGPSVDIAAPGCRLASWQRNTVEEFRQSGTSSAAPLVSFAALLLSATSDVFTPARLRTRLVVSGEMLAGADHAMTAYGTALHIERALYWTHDLVRLKAPESPAPESPAPESPMLLGEITSVTGLSCDGAALGMRNLWALKRDNTGALWAFRGRNAETLMPPCRVSEGPTADARMVVQRLVSSSQNVSASEERHLPLTEVREIVFAAPWSPVK